MHARKISFVLISLFLVGCANGVPKDYAFTSESEKGLIVVGLATPGVMAGSAFKMSMYGESAVGISVARLNENGTLAISSGDFINHRGGAKIGYYVMSLSPGTYVFREARRREGNVEYISCLSSGTYEFKVESGKVKYVGDIEYNAQRSLRGRVRFRGFSDDASVDAALSEYTMIQVEFERAQLAPATFPRGRDLFGTQDVCGGYYQKVPVGGSNIEAE